MVQTTNADQEFPFEGVDLDRNYAHDANVHAWVQAELAGLIPHIQALRQSLEEEWREIRRASMLQHDANQKYVGRSNVYIPQWAKALDTLVTQTINGVFPSDETISVKSTLGGEEGDAQAVADYILYEFAKQAKVRVNLQGAIRNFWEYGTGVIKDWYAKELVKLSRREFRRRGRGDAFADSIPDLVSTFDAEGYRISSRNLFNVYVWPFSAESPEDATLIFETINVPFKFIDQQVRAGRWRAEDAEQVKGGSWNPTHEYNQMQAMLDSTNINATSTISPTPGQELGQTRVVVEAWCDIPLPASAYSRDEDPGYPLPCKVVLSGTTVLEVRRNPFFHQKPPFLFLRARREGGAFYGKGNGFFARQLQYLVNDLGNQMNDNGTYALNPVAFMNVNLIAGPPPAIHPGAVFSVLGDGAIRFDRPPAEQIQHGLALLGLWRAMSDDVSGAPPIMQGTNAGKGARTATSSQILQRNASQPLQAVVADIEEFWMVPLMRRCWLAGQQYRSSDVFARVAGRDIRVAPQQLVGDYDFAWLASNQTVNAQARAAQANQFLAAVMNPLAVQLLQQQGKQLNLVPIFRRLWTDGLGYRNFDEIVSDAGMPMMGMGMPGPMGGGEGGPEMAEGSGDRSAIPGSGEMVPGEGEDFSAVRQGADSMAAGMGGLR